MAILHAVKEALAERRLAQYEAAEAIGVSETRFSRVIRGRAEASPQEKRSLARLLGATVEELFPVRTASSGAEAQTRRAR